MQHLVVLCYVFDYLYTKIYSFTGEGEKKTTRKKNVIFPLTEAISTSFLTAYFRQQHYRTLLHMCRNKKEAQNELKKQNDLNQP